MKAILATLLLFTLNGCFECQPKPCKKTECKLPKLPTYKVPKSNKFDVKKFDENSSIIKNDILWELVHNNTKLRGICLKYCLINKKINEVYK